MTRRPLFSALILLATAGLILFGAMTFTRRADRFYSLMTDGPSAEEVADFLMAEGIGLTVTAGDPVVYSDFTALKRIPLRDLSDRFLGSDRRFDPYLKELSDLFMTPRGDRVFFRSDRSLLSLTLLLYPLRDRILWEQAVPPAALFMIPAVFLILSGVNLFRYRRNFFAPLMVQILWLPYYFYHPGISLILLPLLIHWEILILDSWGHRWGRAAVRSLMVIISGILLSSGLSLFLFFILLALIFSLGLFLKSRSRPAPASGRVARRAALIPRKREHELFEPVYFDRSHLSGGLASPSEPGLGTFFSALILALPLLLFSPGGETKASYAFPGPGDFYNHIYYQENLLYALPWASREPVVHSEYTWDSDTGEIIERKEIISSFSEEWMKKARETYGTGMADSFLLDLPAGTEFLPIYFSLDFNKYSIFAIILLFFLSELVMTQSGLSGKEKKSLQIIKRGREVA